MSRLLLVLGVGFLGKEIVRLGEEAGYEVVGASRRGGAGLELADLTDLGSLEKLKEEFTPDVVIHCAASGRSKDRVASYTAVYQKGCENVARVFAGAKLIFTSSTSVYAQCDGSTVTEESETSPESATGKILLAAEEAILHAGGTVARLSGIYGQGRSYMIKRLLSGEAVIEGGGSRLLNHIHHVDAARACLFLIDQAAGVYNVSDSVCLTQKDTYARLCELLDVEMPPHVEQVTASVRGLSHKCVSNNKLLGLGWEPLYPCFADTALELVDSVA